MKLVLFSLLALSVIAVGDRATPGGVSDENPAETIKTAALRFLDALSPELREQATFAFTDEERKKWSNLPHTSFERLGVRFGELSAEQRVLGHKLIASALSSQGYLKTTGIMHLDEILAGFARRAGRGSEMFGHGFYWIGIFGDPAEDAEWGWQLDGHHLALNFTIVDGEVAVTPAFMGTDPAEVRRDTFSGWRILGAEDDTGRRLFDALEADQRASAIIDAVAPRDVIAGPGRADRLKEVTGLPASRMNAPQRALLMQLIEEYAHNLEHDLAHAQLERIKEAGIDEIHFAWAGTEAGKPYYYRVHGPTVLIEFDNSYPPGRRAGPVNHIHTVWRDLENDYGADLLREHYEKSPHHRDRRDR